MRLVERVPITPGHPGVDRSEDALVGLGAIAVMAVVASALRVPGLPGGWIGLEVVLVLVGFVATRALLAERTGEPRRSWVPLVRLLAVVVPATAVPVAFAVTWTFVQDGEVSSRVRNAAVAVIGQFYDLAVVAGRVDERAFGAWWPVSLAVQLVVIAWPVSWVLGRRPERAAATLVVLVAVVVLLARIVLIGAGGAVATAVRLPWLHADGFLVGMAAALVHRQLVVSERQRLFRSTLPAVGALVFLAVAVPWTIWDERAALLVVPAAAILAGIVVLSLGARSAPPGLSACLSARPLVWVGRRGLGIFLWHHPVGLMLVAGGADRWGGPWLLARQLGLTLVLAVASYEFIERPLLARLTPNRP